MKSTRQNMKASGSDEGVGERTAAPGARTYLRLDILTAVAVVIGLVLVLATSRARRTEQFLAQLRAKGEKLTYRELTGGDSAITNPAPQVVTNAANAFEALDYSASDLDFSFFPRPGRMRVAWKQAAVPDKRPGKTVRWEELANYLQRASEPLEALREVLTTAPPEWGRRTNHSQASLQNFSSIDCARWLCAATISELHANQLELALRDLEVLGALVRADTLDYSLISAIVRTGVGHLGLWATWQAGQAEGWSDQQLERLQRTWADLDLPEAVEHGLLGERVCGIGYWEQFRRSDRRQVMGLFTGSPQARGSYKTALRLWVAWPAYKITSMDADEVLYLDTMGGAIDEARQIRAHRPWDRRKSKAAFAARINQTTRPLTRWRYTLSGAFLPNYTEVLEHAVRTETLRQLTLTAIAIKRYHLRHHSPPPDLAALVPEFLKSPTYDPMSGGPLRYRPGENGEFLLYSIGEDGQDDGGDPRPSAGSKLDLWEGRDAVFPSAE
ncbi:MAG TPA: hypothetical protein VJA21_06765 [Verrucomicrobiae bacterium]